MVTGSNECNNEETIIKEFPNSNSEILSDLSAYSGLPYTSNKK